MWINEVWDHSEGKMKGYPKRKEHKKPFGSPVFHNKTQNRFKKKRCTLNGTSTLTPHHQGLGDVVEEEAKECKPENGMGTVERLLGQDISIALINQLHLLCTRSNRPQIPEEIKKTIFRPQPNRGAIGSG